MPQPATPFSFVLEIRDPDGDVCANGEADVPCRVSISTYPSGSEGAVLSGTLTKTPVAGVLTFDDLQIDLEGTGYVLKVEPDPELSVYRTLEPKFSDAFNVLGLELLIDWFSPVDDYNVYDEVVALYGVPPADAHVNIVIYSQVSSTSPLVAAFDVGTGWTGSPTFHIENRSIIAGAKGTGGSAPTNGSINGGDGGAGGAAIELNGYAATIDNYNGSIYGGGGGGGGGGGLSWTAFGDFVPVWYASSAGFSGGTSGGNGAGTGGTTPTTSWGYFDGADVVGYGFFSSATCTLTYHYSNLAAGGAGSLYAGGAGGVVNAAIGIADYFRQTPFPSNEGRLRPGDGGAGGASGAAGSNGSAGIFQDDADSYTTSFTGYSMGSGGSGGAAGNAISLSGGSATFTSASMWNTSPYVIGAVS